jgi:hypothetical protein
MDSVKPQKQPKTCHNCGLEAIDDCDNNGQHIPSDGERAPCKFCERNLTSETIASDFWNENWILDANGNAKFDDIGKVEEALLDLLAYAIEFFED